jgi:hypothetical protein
VAGLPGFEPISGGPERFASLLRETVARFPAVAALANISRDKA